MPLAIYMGLDYVDAVYMVLAAAARTHARAALCSLRRQDV